MARIGVTGMTLLIGDQVVPVADVRLPDLPRGEIPALPQPATARFRVSGITFADPVDRELVELGVLDRRAVHALSPNELREARQAAEWDVFVDRLMSSVALPRRRRG